MEKFNSCDTKAKTIGAGMTQVARTMVTSTMALTVILVLAGIAMGLSGCSKEKSKQSSVNSTQTTPSPVASTTSSVSSTELVVAKKKKAAVTRSSAFTYSSNTYGVSFRFPRQYELTTPGSGGTKSELTEEVPKNFAQPGGVTVATIDLAGGPATSFFSVSANKSLNSEECSQFSTPSPSDIAGTSPVDESDSSIPSKTSIHGVAYTKVENATEEEDVKYYHHFEPGSDGVSGTCYEFALGVEQSRVSSKTLDYSEQFDKLDRVMASVEIKPHESSTVTATVPVHEPSVTSPQ